MGQAGIEGEEIVMGNRLLTPDEVVDRMIDRSKLQTGGDERAAMILLGCLFGMAGKPPKSDLDYLAEVLERVS